MPSEPPRVRKYSPLRWGGQYRTTAGEEVSASSKMITSCLGSCASQLGHEAAHLHGACIADALVCGQCSRTFGCLGGAQFFGALRSRPFLACRHDLGQGLGQQRQRQLGIGHHALIHPMVLGDLVGIQVDVDDLRRLGEDVPQLREDFRQHIGADDQVGVAPLHDGQAGKAEHVAGHPLVERDDRSGC